MPLERQCTLSNVVRRDSRRLRRSFGVELAERLVLANPRIHKLELLEVTHTVRQRANLEIFRVPAHGGNVVDVFQSITRADTI